MSLLLVTIVTYYPKIFDDLWNFNSFLFILNDNKSISEGKLREKNIIINLMYYIKQVIIYFTLQSYHVFLTPPLIR